MFSIVLVILGILGIIGIAVYLGVVQKIEDSGRDLVSIDGAFRVVSEDFSISLLNPTSVRYKENSKKYSGIIERTYKKSLLQESLVSVIIDGFSSGSVKVFFKIILDKKKLPGRTAEDPVLSAKDVFIQEVMTLENSEFGSDTIDLDSIEFSLSAVQDITKKYLDPEPLQGDETSSPLSGSLWQNLAQSSRVTTEKPVSSSSERISLSWQGQDRVESAPPETVKQEVVSNNGWTLPKYPSPQTYGQSRSNLIYNPTFTNFASANTPVLLKPNDGRSIIFESDTNPSSRYDSGFKSSLYSSTPSARPVYPSPNPSYKMNRRIDSGFETDKLMSEYLEAPPPPTEYTPDIILAEEEPISDLQQLFRQRSRDSMSSLRSSERPEPAPIPSQDLGGGGFLNRRIDTAPSSVDVKDSFWNVMEKRIKDTEERTEQVNKPIQSTSQPSLSIDENLLQMQEELERLIALEAKNQKQRQMEKMIPVEKRNPGLSWNSRRNNPESVVINNLGSSGMKPITPRHSATPSTSPGPNFLDVLVPEGQNEGFFGVGSSLSFDSKPAPSRGSIQSSLVNRVPSIHQEQVITPSNSYGADPNIIYPNQITPGTPLLQGPQGPIISTPRLPNYTVPQTPDAPIMQGSDYSYNRVNNVQRSRESILSGNQYKGQFGVNPILRSSTQPPRRSPPTQLNQGRTQDLNRRIEPASERQKAARRQDIIGGLLPAAIGLSSSVGISPVGIFSNLLNAYATIDSKHDITGKLINGAATWFQGSEENQEASDQDSTTTTTTTTDASTSSLNSKTLNVETSTPTPTITTTATTSTTASSPLKYTPTAINVRVTDKISTFSYSSEDEKEYYSLLQKIRSGIDLDSDESADNSEFDSEYDVVYDILPARSNLGIDIPLRPKPPSEDIVQVSPSPVRYNNPSEQYGVNNPNWFSNNVPSSTPGYGPDDFVVETVNLDKNFFYQFFTSKPMILDTDVVTSTSVKESYAPYYPTSDKLPMKRGRETLSNLPEHIVGQDLLPEHILKRTGELESDTLDEPSPSLPEIINKSSQFKRYNVPPEVRITHGVQIPNYRSLSNEPFQTENLSESEKSSPVDSDSEENV